MGGYVHKPVTWNREASALWAAGMRDAAVTMSLTALDADAKRRRSSAKRQL